MQHLRRPDFRQLDEGFSLIEVMVAFALFAVMATACLSVLMTTATVAADDGLRPTAADLANRELEIVRDRLQRDPDGLKVFSTSQTSVNPNPIREDRVVTAQELASQNRPNSFLNGTSFMVRRTLQWQSVGAEAKSFCEPGAGSSLDYLAVGITVTWRTDQTDLNEGRRQRLTINSLVTPPVTAYQNGGVGHLAVRIIGADGRGREAVPVKATAASGAVVRQGQTQDDGCFVADKIAPGTYTVTATEVGSVTPAGDAVARVSARVEAGSVWRGTLQYDAAASVQASFVTAPGHALPTSIDRPGALPITLGNSAFQPYGSRAVEGQGSNRTLSGLWPYPSGYQMWGGRCLDNDPQYSSAPGAEADNSAVSSGAAGDGSGDPTDGDSVQSVPAGTRDLPVTVRAGGTVSASVRLTPVVVRAAPGMVLAAVQPDRGDADVQCATGPRLELGTAGADGTLKTSLPVGSWSIAPAASAGSQSVVRIPALPVDGFGQPIEVTVS